MRAPRWPDGDDRREESARFGGAGEAMHAVSRLLGSAAGADGPAVVADTLVREAHSFFRVGNVILLSMGEPGGSTEVTATEPERGSGQEPVPIPELPAVVGLLGSGDPLRLLSGDSAAALARKLGAGPDMRAALLLPITVSEAVRHVLVLLDASERLELDAEQVEVAQAFAAAAGAGLSRLELAADGAAQIARQASLARAARTVNESLELNRVLVRICEEAASILDADYANVFLGNAEEGLRFEATYGLPAEVIGAHVATGEGLVGKVVERDTSMLTNDYAGLARPIDLPEFRRVRSSVAVPMHWEGELRGALAVGYFNPYQVGQEHLSLLEAFAELAAAACRNASAHAGLVLAARTDSLTGCLNHAALHDTLQRELERCRRTGHSTSLAIVDLDDFKQVNEQHGHLAGDEVLRRVGKALRQSVRPYDLVARYGGDEFAIVAVDADEREATEVATRAIEGVRRLTRGSDAHGLPVGATAGVAEWQAGEGPTGLIARADRALLFGKQQGSRGAAMRAAEVPGDFLPLGKEREPVPSENGADGALWSDRAREQTERLRRRTRQLALADRLGSRIAALGDPLEIVDAAVDELHRAFEHYLAAILRVRGDGYLESVAVRGMAFASLGDNRWAQPVESGLIGRCMRERRPVLSGDVRSEPDYRLVPGMVDVRSELAAPIWVGERLWGAIDLEDVRANAFDQDDARLIRTVALQIGSALQVSSLRAQLESAGAGTTEALAAAAEPRTGCSRRLERLSAGVGERLQLNEESLAVIACAARFHTLGKVAVPEQILDKPGELSEEERAAIENHPLAGERILSSVRSLESVRHLVRHGHERFDGSGYPDGLAGQAIPMGSRVIFACSAYLAMLQDRPYRSARTPEDARAELRRCAGSQFDPAVVEVLLELLESQTEAEADIESSSVRQSRSTLTS